MNRSRFIHFSEVWISRLGQALGQPSSNWCVYFVLIKLAGNLNCSKMYEPRMKHVISRKKWTLWITATATCRLWQIMPKPHFGKIFFLSLLLCGKNCVWDIWLARLMTTEHILNYNCANFYGSKLPRWYSNFITFGWTYCTFKVYSRLPKAAFILWSYLQIIVEVCENPKWLSVSDWFWKEIF